MAETRGNNIRECFWEFPRGLTESDQSFPFSFIINIRTWLLYNQCRVVTWGFSSEASKKLEGSPREDICEWHYPGPYSWVKAAAILRLPLFTAQRLTQLDCVIVQNRLFLNTVAIWTRVQVLNSKPSSPKSQGHFSPPETCMVQVTYFHSSTSTFRVMRPVAFMFQEVSPVP